MGVLGHLRGPGAVLLTIVVAACASPAPPTTPPSATPSSTTAGSSPNGQSTAPEPSASAPAPSAGSSQDLIAADLASGAIDLATSLELRAWTLFGDPRLPARYDGTGSTGEDSALVDDIAMNLESLPADKQAELSRYLVRPTDPKSPFSAPKTATGGIRLARADITTALAVATGEPCGDGGQWFDRDWTPAGGSANDGFRVWACADNEGQTTADFDIVTGIASDLWSKMTVAEPNGMGRPVPDLYTAGDGSPRGDGSAKVDIYLLDAIAPCRQRGDNCETIPGDAVAAAQKDWPVHCGVEGFPENGCSGYMLLGRGRTDDPDFAGVFAHEFFHVLQFAHNGKVQTSWYSEASAVWAGWYFKRDSYKDRAYGRFKAYQKENRSLLWYDYHSLYQYQAWGWPLFQALEAGPPNVFQAWSAIESATTRAEVDVAIDSKLEFATAFRDFAVRNAQPQDYIEGASTGLEDDTWQTNPDLADFPPDKHLVSAARTEIHLGTSSHSVEIQPLAAQYDEYKATDPNIAQIKIDISQLPNAGQVDLDALGQLNGVDTWHRFRASGSTLTLCREKPDQNVTFMELVISNHLSARSTPDSDFPDFGKVVKGQYTIEAKDKCEEQDVLLHGTFIGHGEDVLQTSDATFNVDIVWHRPDNPNDALNFELVSGSFTWDTTVVGVCAGTLGEGGNLEPPSTGNSQGLSYGDATQGSHYASVVLRDSRLDNGTVAFFINGKFDLPNSSSECQPPFEPYGYIPDCPPQFKVLPDGTLETDATCEDSVGTKWTGHLAGQQ